MTPLMDPFQMKIIKSVFNASSLSVGARMMLDMPPFPFQVQALNMRTCCPDRKWKNIMALEVMREISVIMMTNFRRIKEPKLLWAFQRSS